MARSKRGNKKNNSVYLEDELGDVFWDYLCLLYSLEKERKITSVDKVFERSYKKFSQRIESVRKSIPGQDGVWKQVKDKQKKQNREEHKKLYGN